MLAFFLVIVLLLLLIIVVLFVQVTIRLRFVYGSKEKYFRWQIGIFKDAIHKEFNYFPDDKLEEEVKKRGRERAIMQLQQILRRMSFWQVDAFALLGVGDAAATALCCGLVDAAINALGCALLPKGKKGRGWMLKTMPSFDVKTLEAQIHGIFRIRIVQIILAALAWRKQMSGRDEHDASD